MGRIDARAHADQHARRERTACGCGAGPAGAPAWPAAAPAAAAWEPPAPACRAAGRPQPGRAGAPARPYWTGGSRSPTAGPAGLPTASGWVTCDQAANAAGPAGRPARPPSGLPFRARSTGRAVPGRAVPWYPGRAVSGRAVSGRCLARRWFLGRAVPGIPPAAAPAGPGARPDRRYPRSRSSAAAPARHQHAPAARPRPRPRPPAAAAPAAAVPAAPGAPACGGHRGPASGAAPGPVTVAGPAASAAGASAATCWLSSAAAGLRAGIPGQRGGHQRQQRRRAARQVGLPVHDPVEDRLEGAGAEWRPAGGSEGHRRPPGVHVRRLAGLLALDDLRSKVAGSAHEHPGLGNPGRVRRVRDAEVDHDRLAAGQHDVPGLQVPVHDACRVHGRQGGGEPAAHRGQLLAAQRAVLGDDLLERPAPHVPGDDVGRVAGHVGIDDFGHERAAYPPHQSRPRGPGGAGRSGRRPPPAAAP